MRSGSVVPGADPAGIHVVLPEHAAVRAARGRGLLAAGHTARWTSDRQRRIHRDARSGNPSLAARFPEDRAQSIGVDRRNGHYSILFRLPGDLSTNGDNWAFIDLATGDIIGTKLTATEGADDESCQQRGNWAGAVALPRRRRRIRGYHGRQGHTSR